MGSMGERQGLQVSECLVRHTVDVPCIMYGIISRPAAASGYVCISTLCRYQRTACTVSDRLLLGRIIWMALAHDLRRYAGQHGDGQQTLVEGPEATLVQDPSQGRATLRFVSSMERPWSSMNRAVTTVDESADRWV